MITLSSDFGVQSQGVGLMEAAVYEINPQARVVHLMHGLPDYDITTAAWAMETAGCIRPAIHVCVVDPGVGSKRMGLIIQAKRGDFLIGPDNGVLIPAARLFGGIKHAVSISNTKYMRKHVSPVFHGRDMFAPAAAYLSKGEPIFDFGPVIDEGQLVQAPYNEARVENGAVKARIIHINKFGSAHLNILHHEFDRFRLKAGSAMLLFVRDRKVPLLFARTFSDVKRGHPLVFKDDYWRMEIALNQGNLASRLGLRVGQEVMLRPHHK
jgi:hypothetical protein